MKTRYSITYKILNFIFLVIIAASCKESATNGLSEDTSGGTGEMFTVSFKRSGGIPFEGGALVGIEGTKGINCNNTTLFDCEAKFPANSKVVFKMPAVINTALGKLKYGGSIKCNDKVVAVAQKGDFVVLPFQKLHQNFNCSFLFVPM